MGSETLGFLMGALAFGAMIGAIYLASRKTVVGLGRIIAIALSLWSHADRLFLLAPSVAFAPHRPDRRLRNADQFRFGQYRPANIDR